MWLVSVAVILVPGSQSIPQLTAGAAARLYPLREWTSAARDSRQSGVSWGLGLIRDYWRLPSGFHGLVPECLQGVLSGEWG